MSVFANQNNIYFNGFFASGISSLTTGAAVQTRGFGKYSMVIEAISDTTGNKGSLTGSIQVLVHPSQTNWATLFTTGFNNQNGAALFQTLGQFDAVRVVCNPYNSGTLNVWFEASQT